MISKVPVIEQCTVSNSMDSEILVEALEAYLDRNKNLIFPHRHNFCHFVLFTSGEGSHTIDFETFEIEPWQIYFMSPGQIHSWNFEGQMQGFVVNFESDVFKNFLIRPDYLSTFSFFGGSIKDEVFVVEEGKRATVLTILNELAANLDNRDFVSTSLLYLFQLLQLQRASSSKSLQTNAYNHVLVRNFLSLIELNYNNLKLPKDYAALLYITPNHLNALCKELLGLSAGEIIRNRIILEAKRLLVIKGHSIAEIAYQLNFSDNSYFTKFFKKIEGVTPEEFRKNNT